MATDAFEEFVVGHGELWCAQLTSARCRQLGAECEFMDTREVLVVSPTADGNSVDVHYDTSNARLDEWGQRHGSPKIIVATGGGAGGRVGGGGSERGRREGEGRRRRCCTAGLAALVDKTCSSSGGGARCPGQPGPGGRPATFGAPARSRALWRASTHVPCPSVSRLLPAQASSPRTR